MARSRTTTGSTVPEMVLDEYGTLGDGTAIGVSPLAVSGDESVVNTIRWPSLGINENMTIGYESTSYYLFTFKIEYPSLNYKIKYTVESRKESNAREAVRNFLEKEVLIPQPGTEGLTPVVTLLEVRQK